MYLGLCRKRSRPRSGGCRTCCDGKTVDAARRSCPCLYSGIGESRKTVPSVLPRPTSPCACTTHARPVGNLACTRAPHRPCNAQLAALAAIRLDINGFGEVFCDRILWVGWLLPDRCQTIREVPPLLRLRGDILTITQYQKIEPEETIRGKSPSTIHNCVRPYT